MHSLRSVPILWRRAAQVSVGTSVVVVAAFLVTGAASVHSMTTTTRATASTGATTGRHLLYSDTFTGAAGTAPNTGVWTALTGGGGWGNNELQSYTARPSNVSLDGAGDLRITARQESYTGSDGITSHYTSARVISRAPVRYGYIEARIHLPAGQGLWPAFWTIGANVYQGVPWPRTGEIDIMEAQNKMPRVWGTIHGPTTKGTAYAIAHSKTPPTALAGGWHVYAINWTSTKITWYLDGVPYASVSKAQLAPNEVWELTTPQLIQLNLAVGGQAGKPTASAFPASMLVDYVRVYSN